jgi:hypothetical protein
MQGTKRRLLALGIGILLLTFGQAEAQEASARPRYAVMSLLADAMNVVTYQAATGSHMNKNTREVLPLEGAGFDSLVLLAVKSELDKSPMPASAVLMRMAEPAQLTTHDAWVKQGQLHLPEALADAAAHSGASHLLILLPQRSEALLNGRAQALGSGTIEGLGFYVDRQRPMRRADTGETSIGFLAPFLHARLILVEVATGRVLGEQRINASRTLSTARNTESFNPWDALTSAQKIETLRAMLRREVAKASAHLLQSAAITGVP